MSATSTINQTDPFGLAKFTDTAPTLVLNLLFIHHSCGGQLLADPGAEVGANCIYKTHPNGGGLRARLEKNSYFIHEVSYDSRIGERTDIFDWPAKFHSQMEAILICESQDTPFSNGHQNNIVVFKSCFPNNNFIAAGQPPGNAAGPELTVWNAKAAYTALLEEFGKHPKVLFVCVTAPPLAPLAPQTALRQLAKKILGRADESVARAWLAREFNDWLAGADGWLNDYKLNNVAVFNYYDILTDYGAANFLRFPTGDGFDSHPSRAGNEIAAKAFVPFLNQAVRDAGLSS